MTTVRFASMSIPTFITIVVCISILILAGGIAMIILNRPPPLQSPSREKVRSLLFHQQFYPGQKVVAKFSYERNLSDELTVLAGDEILIKMIYDDNWCLGRNTSTEKEGTFPLLCLQSILEIEQLKKRLSSRLGRVGTPPPSAV
ncbi:UNVERIFIED_CONTAM: hypothetical protein HDU68_007606 [Siphonaria sp. JEL0065]|nr:hypothetical protein HDU68_007606 [Siphonaria sp. JEL0065]